MNLIGSFGFCIFLATLTTAWMEVRSEHDEHTDIDCRLNSRHLGQTVVNSMCKVHDRLVDLKPMRGYRFSPSRVSVKRCDGFCRPGLSCEPIKRRMTKAYVDAKSVFHAKRQCFAVEVEEHLLCRCKCTQKKSDCNDRQMFNDTKCRCECTNENETKMKCEKQEGMWWDGDNCSCKCMKIPTECTTGHTWSDEKCECVRT